MSVFSPARKQVLVVLNCLGSATAALVVIGGIAPTTFADIATLSGDSKIVDDDGPLCVCGA